MQTNKNLFPNSNSNFWSSFFSGEKVIFTEHAYKYILKFIYGENLIIITKVNAAPIAISDQWWLLLTFRNSSLKLDSCSALEGNKMERKNKKVNIRGFWIISSTCKYRGCVKNTGLKNLKMLKWKVFRWKAQTMFFRQVFMD